MKNQKSVRALLLSALSLLLCVSMLVGSTFAWFTDSVVSANNVIKSGNLDIEVQYTLDGENWADLDGADDLFKKGLWEPGHVEVVALKIENVGSLALKYTATMNIVEEIKGVNQAGAEFALSDYLVATTVTQEANMVGDILVSLAFGNRDANTDDTNTVAFKELGKLNQGANALVPGAAHYTIVRVEMPETVGNEANHNGLNQPFIHFGINVLATQQVHEADSFDNQYDKDATYPTVVNTDAELNDALVAGEKNIKVAAGTYTLPTSKLTAETTLTCEPGTVFSGTSDLNVKGATVVGATFSNPAGTAVKGTVNGTFKDCTFNGSETLRWCYTTAGTTTVFEDCVINTDFRGVHFDEMNGDVIFRNCEINGFNAYSGTGTMTFEKCIFGNDASGYNGLNIYSNTNLVDCTFNFISGKTNFIDMEGTGKTLTITGCTATLDGVAADIADFVGGSKLAQNTVVYN